MITVTGLKGLNAILIKKELNDKTFLTTSNSIVISIPSLSYLIKFLVLNGYMSRKVLEGILSEISDYRKD